MVDTDQGRQQPGFDYNDHIDRCLSMVLHYEEVRQIAEIVKGILADRHESRATTERT